MERVGGRQEKMEGHCSTGQSPQWAVVPMEEEEEEEGRQVGTKIYRLLCYAAGVLGHLQSESIQHWKSHELQRLLCHSEGKDILKHTTSIPQ